MATLQSGIVVAVSNGSAKDGRGTYASYRSELTGLLAIQALLKCLIDYCKEHILSKVMAHGDNVSALSVNNQERAFPGVAAHTSSDFDLLQEICSYRSFTHVKAVWVEAHQHTKYPGRELSQEAVLNCKVDANASACMESNNDTSITPPVLSTSISTLTLNDIVVVNKPKELLCNSANCADIYTYIRTKTLWASK
eukprot:13085169-Ditylum_brightwellii.AAC.1